MNKLPLAVLTWLTWLTVGCAYDPDQATASDWFTPWQHRHASQAGTPYVHPIGMEPAFFGRELLFAYQSYEASDESENELETEVEWAVTRRLGLAVEAPFVRVSRSGEATHEGIGDLSIAPRALLVETERFLLAASLGLAVPTGDSDRDLGDGEASLSPGLSSWSDLGGLVTLQAHIGTQRGLETGDTLLDYHGALIWSLADAHDHGEHLHAGMTSLIAEVGGRTVLDGPDESRSTAEALLGLSYCSRQQWEFRGGFQLPIGGQQDIDYGFVVGAIFHF